MNQQKIRNLHRDLGYFYIGLIISFALSGILMNHRDSFHAEKYTVQTRAINIKIPEDALITEKYADSLGHKLGIEDKIRRHKVDEDQLRISFEKNDVEIDLKTGKGEIVTFIKTPIISSMMKLHKNTSNWWIYYSDVFGISLVIIAITGAIMIKVGNKTFNKRGWKLALAGLIVPLLILLFV